MKCSPGASWSSPRPFSRRVRAHSLARRAHARARSPGESELPARAAAQLVNAMHGKEMTPPMVPPRDRPRKPSKEEKTAEMVRVPVQYQTTGNNRGRATEDDDEA